MSDQDRIRPRNSLPDSGEIGPGTIDPVDELPDPTAAPPFRLNTTPSTSDTKLPRNLLVCWQCEQYWEDDEDWSYCPECSADLAVVSRA